MSLNKQRRHLILSLVVLGVGLLMALLYFRNAAVRSVQTLTLNTLSLDKLPNLPQLQVGDVILRRGVGADSLVISTISHSRFSHSGIVVATEPVVLVSHATTADDAGVTQYLSILRALYLKEQALKSGEIKPLSQQNQSHLPHQSRDIAVTSVEQSQHSQVAMTSIATSLNKDSAQPQLNDRNLTQAPANADTSSAHVGNVGNGVISGNVGAEDNVRDRGNASTEEIELKRDLTTHLDPNWANVYAIQSKLTGDRVITMPLKFYVEQATELAVVRYHSLTPKMYPKIQAFLRQLEGYPFSLYTTSPHSIYCTTLIEQALNQVLATKLTRQKVNMPIASGDYLFPEAFLHDPQAELIFSYAQKAVGSPKSMVKPE